MTNTSLTFSITTTCSTTTTSTLTLTTTTTTGLEMHLHLEPWYIFFIHFFILLILYTARLWVIATTSQRQWWQWEGWTQERAQATGTWDALLSRAIVHFFFFFFFFSSINIFLQVDFILLPEHYQYHPCNTSKHNKHPHNMSKHDYHPSTHQNVSAPISMVRRQQAGMGRARGGEDQRRYTLEMQYLRLEPFGMFFLLFFFFFFFFFYIFSKLHCESTTTVPRSTKKAQEMCWWA